MKSGTSPQLRNPRRRIASSPVVPMRVYFRTSASSVWRESSPPTPGDVSYDSRIVRPESGPNSLKTVVSSTKLAVSGMNVPF